MTEHPRTLVLQGHSGLTLEKRLLRSEDRAWHSQPGLSAISTELFYTVRFGFGACEMG